VCVGHKVAVKVDSRNELIVREIEITSQRERERVRANMHCQGIACSRSFYIRLTSPEGQKIECFQVSKRASFKQKMAKCYVERLKIENFGSHPIIKLFLLNIFKPKILSSTTSNIYLDWTLPDKSIMLALIEKSMSDLASTPGQYKYLKRVLDADCTLLVIKLQTLVGCSISIAFSPLDPPMSVL